MLGKGHGGLYKAPTKDEESYLESGISFSLLFIAYFFFNFLAFSFNYCTDDL